MAKGPKTGGRHKGSKNVMTAAIKQDIAAAGGELPLSYMLRVMRDEDAPAERRDYMARAAAPYLHSVRKPVEGEVQATDRAANRARDTQCAGEADMSLAAPAVLNMRLPTNLPRWHRITIEQVALGDRGHRYRVTYDGRTLIESSRVPAWMPAAPCWHSASPASWKIWRLGKIWPDMQLEIERAAKLTVIENEKEGPALDGGGRSRMPRRMRFLPVRSARRRARAKFPPQSPSEKIVCIAKGSLG